MNATSFNFARDQLFNDLQLKCLQGPGELYIFQDREEGALHFLSDEADFRERVRKLETNGVHFSRAFSIDPEVLEAYGFRAGVLMVFDIELEVWRPEDLYTSTYVAMSFEYERLSDQFLVAKVML
ncbi:MULTISPECIES: hypothetical protein [unclassified Flavobacterium]|uniref:hypothetical protein n=1 Tax=unclassified Flavobacterium TaxID=196869 RepID=UPI001F147B4A|nr:MULTISPECIES: hypothetical protein [unclassified Flavobacterium]UMY65084.1 hypothetical protein MKO97_11260 [Flavobacterium sp. HJ-32-4]